MIKKVNNKRFNFYVIESPIQNKNGKKIILYHGWGTNVYSYNDLAEKLASEGFTVIVPEIIYHDSRSPLENHFDPLTMQKYFWETIFFTINEFDNFIEELEIPTNEIILVGNSMGGFIANGIFVSQKQIGGLVNINGSGSFLLSERIFRERDNRAAIPADLERLLKKFDPSGKTNCQSPVLLMHGDEDTTIPKEGQLDYYNHLTQKENRQDVDILLYKGINHQFSTDMVADLIIWLKTKL